MQSKSIEDIVIFIFWAGGNIFQIYILISIIFYLFLSFTGAFLFPFRRKTSSPVSHKFAILIPAYNEENVIGNILESIEYIDYPKELYDVYVICDHCTDRTEEIAKKYNFVKIISIYNNFSSNKAKALNYATKIILNEKDYDAFCYFDADSLIHPDFLKSMSAMLDKGACAIQGMQLPKNPYESWISSIISSGQFITNYFFQKPKQFLGLSATLHGKGICFKKNIVTNFKWDEHCLTEDLEMQMRLVYNGVRIQWNEYAVVYDEEPVYISQYLKRSIRWARGSLDVAKKHSVNLFLSFLRSFDFKKFEAFIYSIGVYRMVIVFLIAFSLYLTREKFNILIYFFKLLPTDNLLYKFAFIICPLFLFPLFMIFDRNFGFKMFLFYFLQPVLGIFRIPIFILGIMKDRLKWDRTEHISKVRITDLVNLKS